MGSKLVMNRNITVTSVTGNSRRFQKGVPQTVPDNFVQDCMAAGAIPAEGEVIKSHKPAPSVADAPQGAERKQRILDAIEQMVILNERGTFNANGQPKQPQIEKTAGFAIDTREIDTLWREYDAARRLAREVDPSEVVTINDASPVVTENEEAVKSTEESEGLVEGSDNEQNTVEAKAETEEDLGGPAVEAAKEPNKPAKTAPKVSKKKTAKKSA